MGVSRAFTELLTRIANAAMGAALLPESLSRSMVEAQFAPMGGRKGSGTVANISNLPYTTTNIRTHGLRKRDGVLDNIREDAIKYVICVWMVKCACIRVYVRSGRPSDDPATAETDSGCCFRRRRPQVHAAILLPTMCQCRNDFYWGVLQSTVNMNLFFPNATGS